MKITVTTIILFFASSIGFAIFLYWLVPFCKKFLYMRSHNKRKQGLIIELLNRSMAQRSKFRIEVMDGELKGSASEGVCTLAKNNQLCIELIETFAAQQWKGSNCLIFFQFSQANKIVFFHFPSKCLDASRKGDITNLYFEMPTQLEPGQKRKSLRCVPPKGSIAGFGLWPLQPDKPLPTHKNEIAKPLVTYRVNQSNSIALADISAGGACILLRPDNESAMLHYLKPGSRVLALLMLRQPELDAKPLALWVSCLAISMEHLEKKNVWRLCLRFETWASMDDAKNDIMWFPNDENGCVPTLSSLVLRWNMKIHKKN